MKWWQYLIFVLAAVALLFFILSIIPGSQYLIGIAGDVFSFVVDIILNLSVLIFIFPMGAIAGSLTYIGVSLLDSLIETERELRAWQTTALVAILGLAFGAIQIWYMPLLMGTPDTWVRSIAMTDFGLWRPWSGAYENPPIGWGIYGFMTFLITYFILSHSVQ